MNEAIYNQQTGQYEPINDRPDGRKAFALFKARRAEFDAALPELQAERDEVRARLHRLKALELVAWPTEADLAPEDKPGS
jgi:hypothetical protein